MNATTYGLDIAKNVFQLYWVDGETGEVSNRRFSKEELIRFLAECPAGRVALDMGYPRLALEATGGVQPRPVGRTSPGDKVYLQRRPSRLNFDHVRCRWQPAPSPRRAATSRGPTWPTAVANSAGGDSAELELDPRARSPRVAHSTTCQRSAVAGAIFLQFSSSDRCRFFERSLSWRPLCSLVLLPRLERGTY
jgi:hypothetical protein